MVPESTWIGMRIFPVMAVSLGLTLIIEIVFALFWRLQSPRELLLVGAVNLLTNPIVVAGYYLARWLVLKDFPGAPGMEMAWILKGVKLLLEAAAIGTEAFCYRMASRDIQNPWLFSLLANSLSYFTGNLIAKNR